MIPKKKSNITISLNKILLLSTIIIVFAGCGKGYTAEEAAYIRRVRAVNLKSSFPKSSEHILTNKIASFLNGTLKMKMEKVTPDSIITKAAPDEFYWKIKVIKDSDSIRLGIYCGYERAFVKRGELTPRKDAQLDFSEKALMYYLLTGEYVERLICCKECYWMAKNIEAE